MCRLAGGSLLFNTSEPSTPNYQLAYVPELSQLAFMTPSVSAAGEMTQLLLDAPSLFLRVLALWQSYVG